MAGILIRWLITTVAILIVPHLISGVRVDSLGTALWAAAILGILNALIRPVLFLLTLPLTILTLGLFILVINALMFQLAGRSGFGLSRGFLLVRVLRFDHSEPCFVDHEFHGRRWRRGNHGFCQAVG